MTAQEKYQQESVIVKRQLDDLSRMLKSHKQAARKDPNNWGNTGDINHVRELLNEAYEFLGGGTE